MSIDALALLLVGRLLWTSLQAVIFAAVVALLLRALPRIPAWARCVLWWLIPAQVAIGLCCPVPIGLPVLAPIANAMILHVGAGSAAVALPSAGAALTAVPAAFDWNSLLTWQVGLVALWLCGLLLQAPRLLRNHVRMRRLRTDTGEPMAFLRQLCEQLSRQMGFRHCPRLRVSLAVTSPVVSGLIRPMILWPSAPNLSRSETSLVLAHELAHLRRGDLWLGTIAALAQWLFFFHPAVRWAVREYAIHREAACDAAAVRACAADPGDYGELLVRIGVSDAAPAALAGASRTFRSLQRRLTMLPLAGAPAPRLRLWLLVAIVAGVGLVPYCLVSAHPDSLSAANPRVVTRDQTKPVPASSQCLGGDGVSFCGAKFLTVRDAADPQNGLVAFTHRNVMIQGDRDDALAAKRFYSPSANLLWVRRGNQAYLLDDPAVMQRVNGLIVPELEQQSALLKRAESLTNQQESSFDQQQWALKARFKDLPAHLTQLVDAAIASGEAHPVNR